MPGIELLHTLEKLEQAGCDKAALSVLVDIETAREQSFDKTVTLPYSLPDETTLTVELAGENLNMIWLYMADLDPQLFARTIGGPHSPDQLFIDYFRQSEIEGDLLRNWDPLPKVLSRYIADHQLSTQN